jgi:hypothetical protein
VINSDATDTCGKGKVGVGGGVEMSRWSVCIVLVRGETETRLLGNGGTYVAATQHSR